MNIRWRIGALVVQFGALAVVSYIVTGRPIVDEIWFFAGLLAVAINPQLLEPYYPRPGDVIANTIVFFVLYAVTEKTATTLGWQISAVFLGVTCLLAIIGVLVGRGGSVSGVGRAARGLSQIASAQVIYSIVFFLSAIEFRPTFTHDFWVMMTGWATLVIVGRLNWQSIWRSASRGGESCVVEGMIGPSVLIVSSPSLPEAGRWVSIGTEGDMHDGLVLNRIHRKDDVWGQLHLLSPDQCERLLKGGVADVTVLPQRGHSFVGSVDAGSSDRGLKFFATRALRIGEVVGVELEGSRTQIVYQLAHARIEQTDVRGGSHLVTRVEANQLGVFDQAELRFRHYDWVPSPGAAVTSSPIREAVTGKPPASWMLLGEVIGTSAPIFVDSDAASEGHTAILGMTKMGKTTLAERLAHELSKTRSVTILDLTGEYVGKKGLVPWDSSFDLTKPGLAVFEPKRSEVPADRALKFLEYMIDIAVQEYRVGTPFPRTIIVDEAHQFIPEPAGLGFNAPGRDSSFRIGLLLMQVRKYGMSVILISQRTAVVAKSALSQCENLIAFRSVDQTGLDYLEAIAGGNVRNILPGLKQGRALAFGPAITSESPVVVSVARHNWADEPPASPASSQTPAPPAPALAETGSQ